MTLGALAVCAGVGYRVSLLIHPFRRCLWCRGTGKHFGSVFSGTHRPCRHCGGNGRRLRLGAHRPPTSSG